MYLFNLYYLILFNEFIILIVNSCTPTRTCSVGLIIFSRKKFKKKYFILSRMWIKNNNEVSRTKNHLKIYII